MQGESEQRENKGVGSFTNRFRDRGINRQTSRENGGQTDRQTNEQGHKSEIGRMRKKKNSMLCLPASDPVSQSISLLVRKRDQ
mmetsp:Transcript_27097/g.53198  ORF Transcript_27097/g.53198 Transcript_27097/m.53198 type:complete len:83 (+) Transcript_27097:720-968(+)